MQNLPGGHTERGRGEMTLNTKTTTDFPDFADYCLPRVIVSHGLIRINTDYKHEDDNEDENHHLDGNS